ncbi:hypothetical protein AWJ20_4713 [Sugiyamaella lignohabitans]|uniref:Uncharacterized protein n=1 Tax=Sugiyamaella lignohabitans TaxID=796027 RepID=A0A161HKV0_9ASCO|nr:uncharacterized protein AWJ20_4713 [Sugiyamaella lignohabitans]ANB13767.1 hypothetical protein AWJ20_4713 [Sugiyamaella lignohabitans]
MSSLSPIPTSAAERLIRNPHSLPRVPTALANIISQNKHSDRIKHHAEQAYFIRRAKLENQRSERILAAATTNGTSLSGSQYRDANATPSPPSSPILDAVSPTNSRPRVFTHRRNSDTVTSTSVFSPSTQPIDIRRRSSSFTGHNGSPPRSGRPSPSRASRSLSFSHVNNRRLSSIDPRESTTALFNSGVYFIPESPEEDELISLLYPLDATYHGPPVSSSSGPGSPPPNLQHNMAFSSRIFSKKPEERLKQRCYFTKRPAPSWKSRNFEPIKQGKTWVSAHPGWHRFMRNEYKVNGQEDTWREERSRFLQEFRRERQFQKQSKRRMSSHL